MVEKQWSRNFAAMAPGMREQIRAGFLREISGWSDQEWELVFERASKTLGVPSLSGFQKIRDALWKRARANAKKRLIIVWTDDGVEIRGEEEVVELPLTERQAEQLYIDNARHWAEIVEMMGKAYEDGDLNATMSGAFHSLGETMFEASLRQMAMTFGSYAAKEALDKLRR